MFRKCSAFKYAPGSTTIESRNLSSSANECIMLDRQMAYVNSIWKCNASFENEKKTKKNERTKWN